MAVVLVIVGLLLGAIMVGNHLIQAAKIRQEVSQLQNIASATAAFQLKFDALPGDIYNNAPQFGLMQGLPNGGGRDDGFIDDGYGLHPIHSTSGEPMYLLSHLVQANLIPSTFVTGQSVMGYPCYDHTYDVSMNPIGYYSLSINPQYGMVAGGILGHDIWLYLGVWNCSGGNIGGGNAVNGGNGYQTSVNGVMTPYQAYSIDEKMDDGVPATGIVRAEQYAYSGYLDGQVDQQAGECVADYAASTYNLSDNNNWCKLIVELPTE